MALFKLPEKVVRYAGLRTQRQRNKLKWHFFELYNDELNPPAYISKCGAWVFRNDPTKPEINFEEEYVECVPAHKI